MATNYVHSIHRIPLSFGDIHQTAVNICERSSAVLVAGHRLEYCMEVNGRRKINKKQRQNASLPGC